MIEGLNSQLLAERRWQKRNAPSSKCPPASAHCCRCRGRTDAGVKMKLFGLLLVLGASALAAPAAASNAADPALNAVYQRLVATRAANDAAGMASAFDARGLLVDARPEPVISGAELAARLAPMADRIGKDGVRIATAYRVERRSVIGDVAVDAGFMRMEVNRAEGKTARYSRFLVTMRRQADGSWKIIGDASMPSSAEAFDAVARKEGLHYDG
jgi:uncharacterized protein (TIGR02246 family)